MIIIGDLGADLMRGLGVKGWSLPPLFFYL
jgi:hypothetical protein